MFFLKKIFSIYIEKIFNSFVDHHIFISEFLKFFYHPEKYIIFLVLFFNYSNIFFVSLGLLYVKKTIGILNIEMIISEITKISLKI